jgi:hypothetical protein
MQYTKQGNIYKVMRITGNRDNILGVCFTQENNTTLKIIEWPVNKNKPILASKNELSMQVMSGLESINNFLKTNYKLSKIYFLPSESSSDLIYRFLIHKLIIHYHKSSQFE